MHHSPAPLPLTFDYAQGPRPSALRRWGGRALLATLLLPPLLLVVPLIFCACAQAYTERQWGGLNPGLTRPQVDQKLWAFRSYSSEYSGLGPGEFVIRYE